ncbi:hypothetical protein CSUI_009069 [Cystoisospora suis]|uniref:Transmembrane protein n=1 Tax=Cystoisospora suis TaxID=483139 RepID=A0A2C6JJK8_9APIC|nr:hypothetical protein CSUI_009069 [Cystoisospora suis]
MLISNCKEIRLWSLSLELPTFYFDFFVSFQSGWKSISRQSFLTSPFSRVLSDGDVPGWSSHLSSIFSSRLITGWIPYLLKNEQGEEFVHSVVYSLFTFSLSSSVGKESPAPSSSVSSPHFLHSHPTCLLVSFFILSLHSALCFSVPFVLSPSFSSQVSAFFLHSSAVPLPTAAAAAGL